MKTVMMVKSNLFGNPEYRHQTSSNSVLFQRKRLPNKQTNLRIHNISVINKSVFCTQIYNLHNTFLVSVLVQTNLSFYLHYKQKYSHAIIISSDRSVLVFQFSSLHKSVKNDYEQFYRKSNLSAFIKNIS